MATRSFFTSGVITEKNVDKIIEILNSDKKVNCASDKAFNEVRDKAEIRKFFTNQKIKNND